MPAQTLKRRTGLKPKTPRRAGVPRPGVGGYDYPRGPYGATGFPGSTPAAPDTHVDRRPEGARGLRQLTVSQNQAEWVVLPTRRMNGTPRQPLARSHRGEHTGAYTGETGAEQRMTPVIGGAPGSQNVRNQIAQRYKARPELVRAYRVSPNPGKTGAHLDGPALNHPGTMVSGHPDGVPIAGMRSNPGMTPPTVSVQSRFVSREGAQEDYAMNRPLLFTKGGTPAPYPQGYIGNVHLRGARMDGMRYTGALADQQRIGLDSDAYGLSRARGPRHRPVSFQQPEPWTANYYDQQPEMRPPADMIRQSPARPRSRRSVRRG